MRIGESYRIGKSIIYSNVVLSNHVAEYRNVAEYVFFLFITLDVNDVRVFRGSFGDPI